jgi:hypothetical protein
MQMQVFQPQSLAELVATGACLTRIQGDCRLASGSRISVGIMTFMKWSNVKKECPDAYRFRLEGERCTLWSRVITWVVKKVRFVEMRVGYNAANYFREMTPTRTKQ